MFESFVGTSLREIPELTPELIGAAVADHLRELRAAYPELRLSELVLDLGTTEATP
jgi:hypothetical protein